MLSLNWRNFATIVSIPTIHAACGFSSDNAELLKQRLLDAAIHGDATAGTLDAHGQRFVIEYLIEGPASRAWVRTAWIVRSDENFPRFTTAYVM